MIKFKVMWYDQEEVRVIEPDYITANSREEATKIAFEKYNGRPPAPMVYLEEVK